MYKSYYRRKKTLPGTIIFLVLIGLFAFFAYNFRSVRHEEKTVNAVDKASVPLPDKNIISAGTLNAEYRYSCGHIILKEEEIPKSYIGHTPKEISKTHREISDCEYKNGVLSAIYHISAKCPEHYTVKLDGTELIISNQYNPDFKSEKIPINIRGLYEDEVEYLSRGIELYGKEALLEFLEDFSS